MTSFQGFIFSFSTSNEIIVTVVEVSCWYSFTENHQKMFLRYSLRNLTGQFVQSDFLVSPGQGTGIGLCLFVLGTASVPASRDLSQEVAGQGEKVLLPLKETSVESFLRAATPPLAKLQVPREQLSDVMEKIRSGSCGTLYRTMMTTRDHPTPKSVVLKVLAGKVGRFPSLSVVSLYL